MAVVKKVSLGGSSDGRAEKESTGSPGDASGGRDSRRPVATVAGPPVSSWPGSAAATDGGNKESQPGGVTVDVK